MKRCAKYFALALAAICIPGFRAATQTADAPKKDNSQRLVTNFPVPIGENAIDIRIPDWENGKQKMSFYVGVMEHKDPEHIQMTNAKIKTFDENGNNDLTLLLPVSVFDLKTRLLTSDQRFVLRRTDLELIGDSLVLDTVAKQATIKGAVKMIIYNFQQPAVKETPHG